MAGFRALMIAVALSSLAVAQRAVSFPTHYGGLMHANMYGSGRHAIVLAHGGRFKKESWSKPASELASAGFLSLAIAFRGEGKSRGGTQGHAPDEGCRFDVLGAIHCLRRIGAQLRERCRRQYGGDYAAEAAETAPQEIDRLVLLASGAYTPLTRMKGRKLFIVAVTTRTPMGRDCQGFEHSLKRPSNRKS